MIRYAVTVLFCLASALPGQVGGTEEEPATSRPGEIDSVEALVSQMQAREKDVVSAAMEMVTRGTYPGGVTFEITGSIRVLGGTHFHITNRAVFEGELTSEREDVRTPAGVWMRERDQALGEVFLTMTPAQLAEIEKAREAVGEGEAVLDNPVEDPLGSAMLEDLSKHFDLAVERRTIDGADHHVLSGPSRTPAPADGGGGLPAPDHVEILVRLPDLAVVQMTQFQDGRELMQVKITKLELDAPMDESSFRIDLPDGAQFIDVMEHPPAAAQIRMLLEQGKQAVAEQQDAEKQDADKGGR